METNAKNRKATSVEVAKAIHDFLKREEEKQNHYKIYTQDLGHSSGYAHTQIGKCDCCPLWREDL